MCNLYMLCLCVCVCSCEECTHPERLREPWMSVWQCVICTCCVYVCVCSCEEHTEKDCENSLTLDECVTVSVYTLYVLFVCVFV